MSDASEVVFTGFLIPHPKGVIWIQVFYTVILHIDLGDTVIGGREKVIIIKPNFPRPRFEFSIPVRSFRSAQSQMPFPDNSCFIARLF